MVFLPASFYRGLVMNLANRKFQSDRTLVKSSVARNQKTGLQKIEPLFNEQAISFKIRKKLDLNKLYFVFRVVACSKPSAEFRDDLVQGVFSASYRERGAKHLTMHIVSLKSKQSRKQRSKLN